VSAPGSAGPSITQLPAIVAQLPEAERALIERLFSIQGEVGHLRAPQPMWGWIVDRFGAVADISAQRIVRVDNRWTLEGTLFNELRARRPLAGVRRAPAGTVVQDPFADPKRQTPEDLFGRIRGRYCITASNVAKYDAQHAVVIFDEPDPLALGAPALADAFDVARRWYAAAHAEAVDACYPLLIWNSLPRAGASITHAHLQLALARQTPYAGVERLRRAAAGYRTAHAGSYFDALYAAHCALGLGWERHGMRILASLTPVKEKELLVIAPALDDRLATALHKLLRAFTDELEVHAFNLAILQPPLTDGLAGWEDFPVVARLVDRGDPASATSDIAAMELFAASVVAGDPFRLARRLRSATSSK
jgi:hypothetical protein